MRHLLAVQLAANRVNAVFARTAESGRNAQLDAVKRGDITDEELEAARSCVASDLRSLTDSQGELEGFYLSLALDGLDCSPLELAELCEEVTKQDVMDVANSVECDMIYFLKGSGSEEDEDDDAEA